MGRRLIFNESRDEEGFEPRPGQGQGRDLSMDQPMSEVSGLRLGRGHGKDWAGT